MWGMWCRPQRRLRWYSEVPYPTFRSIAKSWSQKMPMDFRCSSALRYWLQTHCVFCFGKHCILCISHRHQIGTYLFTIFVFTHTKWQEDKKTESRRKFHLFCCVLFSRASWHHSIRMTRSHLLCDWLYHLMLNELFDYVDDKNQWCINSTHIWVTRKLYCAVSIRSIVLSPNEVIRRLTVPTLFWILLIKVDAHNFFHSQWFVLVIIDFLNWFAHSLNPLRCLCDK